MIDAGTVLVPVGATSFVVMTVGLPWRAMYLRRGEEGLRRGLEQRYR
jgi:hypothetical protein